MTARSSADGPLPTFLVIGAPKAGTTSLANWLAAHSQVHIPPRKEVRFFDQNFGKGEAWYRHQLAGAGSKPIVGDATPTYLDSPEVPARVAALVPEVRLVA